jgi:hypothetical protein
MKTWRTVPVIGLLAAALLQFEVGAHGQAVGFQPIPAPLPSGVILDATPVVSADRRYVRLGIGVSFNEITGFTNYSVPAAVSGGGGAVGMNGLIGGMGGLGGLGGAGGVGGGAPRAGGFAGPIAGVEFPADELATPTGDPFERALRAQPGANTPIALQPDRDGEQPFRPRASGARKGRAAARDSIRTQPKSATKSRQKAHARRTPKQVTPEFGGEELPYIP